jgi:transcriptional regulator with XRE-family HTH domain
MAESQYQAYEYGTREPAASILEKLARSLNCSTDYLLGLTDNTEADHFGAATDYLLGREAESKKIPGDDEYIDRWAQDLDDMLVESGLKKKGELLSEETYRFIISNIKNYVLAGSKSLKELLELQSISVPIINRTDDIE